MSIQYISLGKLVDLRQGLAINSKSNHLISSKITNLSLLRIADMPTKSKVIFMDENTPERYIARENDIIYTRTGQVGMVFRKQFGVVHNNCFRVIPLKPKELDSSYLFWALSMKSTYNWANSIASGSAQPDLTHTSFKRIKIPYINFDLQKRVGKILDNYDQLIENNSKQIKILEDMANSFYKEWFVRNRFIDHKKNTIEKGIPKGWRLENLFDVANVVYGYPFKSNLFCDNSNLTPVVRIRDIPDNETNTYTSENCNDKFLIRADDILVGMDGIFHMCLWNGETAYLNQRVVKINSTNNDMCNLLLYYSIKDQIKFWETTICGTTVAHLGDKHLKRITVLVPNEETLIKANEFFLNIMVEMRTLIQKNKQLIKQRDLLLPRLMSGKLSVEGKEVI